MMLIELALAFNPISRRRKILVLALLTFIALC